MWNYLRTSPCCWACCYFYQRHIGDEGLDQSQNQAVTVALLFSDILSCCWPLKGKQKTNGCFLLHQQNQSCTSCRYRLVIEGNSKNTVTLCDLLSCIYWWIIVFSTVHFLSIKTVYAWQARWWICSPRDIYFHYVYGCHGEHTHPLTETWSIHGFCLSILPSWCEFWVKHCKLEVVGNFVAWEK